MKYKLRHHNRNDKRDRVKKGFWCVSCDQAYVVDGQRCPVCGTVQNGKTRNKKPGPRE